MAYEQRSYAGNSTDTTLTADLTAGALSFSVAAGDGSNYPDGTGGPFYVIIDYDRSPAEKIRCTARSGDTFTVPASNGRGVDGTTASLHTAGAKVRHCWTATDAQEANRAAFNTVGKVTSKGDLLAGTAANTLARVAAGTDGQILTADSGQTAGVRWAAGNSFHGARVYISADQSIINGGAVVTFDAESFDTDGYHSTVTNTSRITIPAGLAGKYMITGVTDWLANGTGQRAAGVYKNGVAAAWGSAIPGNGSLAVTTTVTTVLDLAVGDYVELFALQNSGGALSVHSITSTDTRLEVAYLGV